MSDARGDATIAAAETLAFDKPLAARAQPGKATRVDLAGGWSAFFGPKSDGEMTARGRSLCVTAKANACAYIERPLPPNAAAVACRLRTEPGDGVTYGPRLGLCWTRGNPCSIRTGHYPHFRMTLTQIGTLSVQHERACSAHVLGFPPGEWVTLRYRFVEGFVVGEVRSRGEPWRVVRVMFAPSRPKWVLIGKAADFNRDIDKGGSPRRFWVEDAQVFAREGGGSVGQ